ncbi:DUF192 domain-containing protein [Lutibaculum baratangense]|uniref:Exported protein n=1 Tax=Lutibaculum baratangense AMV1 TaxID=631454 RepID=V4RJ82_9HYPH|nr:DUF192 domain-containing protein [Lutibaculum baratangense]ESR23330.1 exported protein [Lutibaculum baratangense AMV1]
MTVTLRRAMLALLLFAALPLAAVRAEPLTIESGGEAHVFDVDVARTVAERGRGLMFRKEMAEDYGMLFDFGGEGEVSMWMKNTFIPLDMLFVRADGTIHRIAARTTPFSTQSIPSRGRVKAVLELKGGTAGRLGIAAGDVVRHEVFGNAE